MRRNPLNEEDDAQDALNPDRFYWFAQLAGSILIVFVVAALAIAAHLVDAVEHSQND